MKLGEALTLRSQLQIRIEQLRGRLKASALVQEGEEPPEDPGRLLAEFDDLATQLERLVTQINHTNIATKLPEGNTLTDALARRDALTLRQTVIRQVADVAGERQQRYSRAEIRTLPTVDVGVLRRQADDLARERRGVGGGGPGKEWGADLLE